MIHAIESLRTLWVYRYPIVSLAFCFAILAFLRVLTLWGWEALGVTVEDDFSPHPAFDRPEAAARFCEEMRDMRKALDK